MLAAHGARSAAYCPYSDFHVGAAVLCDDGTIVTGTVVSFVVCHRPHSLFLVYSQVSRCVCVCVCVCVCDRICKHRTGRAFTISK